jgi:hypothetical protein
MARYSETIAAVVEKDPRLEDYYADSDGHWVDIADGWLRYGEVSVVHEWNVRDTLSSIRHDIKKSDG